MPAGLSSKTSNSASRVLIFFSNYCSRRTSFSLVLICFIFGSVKVEGGNNQDSQLEKLLNRYVKEYPTLNVPKIALEYAANLKNIPSLKALRQQSTFFTAAQGELSSIDYQKLSLEEQVKFTWFKNILEDQIERVHLETGFKESEKLVQEGGLFNLPNHKRWYELYSKRFASRLLSSEEIRKIGIEESARIRIEAFNGRKKHAKNI